MGKNLSRQMFLVFSVFVLAGCAQEQPLSIESVSRKEYSETVIDLQTKIEELELQVEGLTETLKSAQSDRIWPSELGDRLVYEVPAIPFALSLPKDSGLPLVALRTPYGLELVYQDSSITQSLRFYSLVPKIRIRKSENPDDYVNPDAVVKDLGNGWTVVVFPALDTSLDEATNAKIRETLDQAVYY